MLNSNLELDYSNADPSIQDLNTFLQMALEKLFPAFDGIIFENGIKKIPLLSSKIGTGTVSDSTNLIVNSGSNGSAAFYTKEKIDLSKFTKLYIQCTNANGSYGIAGWYGIGNAVPASYQQSELISFEAILGSETTKVLDISNCNDSYYLIFETSMSSGESPKRHIEFTRIWLE